MTSTSSAFDSSHPLLHDKQRLNQILDVMYAKIHKILFYEELRPGMRPSKERVLIGSGVSVDDVLAEAFEALLRYPDDKILRSWEGLGVQIAQNKAVSAVRSATTGLRGTEYRDELHLVSIDSFEQYQDSNGEGPYLHLLKQEITDPEEEYSEIENALKLRDFARRILDKPTAEVFFSIHYEGLLRTEVGKILGLTGQRVGQIYNEALERLKNHSDNPFKSEYKHEGETDDHQI